VIRRRSVPRLRDRWRHLARLGVGWMRRAWVPAVGSLCGVGLAAAVWYGVPWAAKRLAAHPYFALAPIEVDGNRWLTRGEVLEQAGVGDGRSVWEAAPHVLRARLLRHPRIQQATVQREFPNHLRIRVEERRPAAIVRLDALNYVDRHGHVLGPLRDDDSRDFPLITGLEGADARDFIPLGLHRAQQLLRLCERLGGFDAISEVHVDRYGGVTVFPLRTAVAVVLGWGSWREKLARSARVFAAWEGQVGRVAAVDVSFREITVVKLREERHPAAVRASKRAMRV
jgi:POTRA domain-containing FtsQ-type protein